MNLQELQQEVLEASFRLHDAKKSLRNAKEMVFELHNKYNIASNKYELALKEQEEFAYKKVFHGCTTLACSAKCIVRLR
jgi:hypothetical protein